MKKHKTLRIWKESSELLDRICKIVGKSKCQLLSELILEIAELTVSYEKASLIYDNSHNQLRVKIFGKKALNEGVSDVE